MISKVDMKVYWTFQEKADDYSLHKREWRILHYKLQKTQMMVSLTLKDTCVTFTSSLSMFSGLIIFPHDESLKAFIIFSKETINPQMTGPSIFLKTIFLLQRKKRQWLLCPLPKYMHAREVYTPCSAQRYSPTTHEQHKLSK